MSGMDRATFRKRVVQGIVAYVERNELLPTHVIISGDLFDVSCDASDTRFVARDPTICGLKVGIDDDAGPDTITVTKVLTKREQGR